VLPNNTLKTPLLLRNNYELAAGDTISQLLNQSVAALAPAGEYTYYACFGAYTGEIFASDSFTFTKLPGDNVNSPYRTWECSEWTEPEVTPHLLHPSSFILSASPNPFNPITTLTYSLPEAAEVSLVVFDVCGREIARLVEEFQPAGNYEVKFKGENLPNGMYFARLLASRQSKTVKLLILK